jgi:CheY-like chemotaxis protein
MGVATDISDEKGLSFPSLAMMDDLDEIETIRPNRHATMSPENINRPKVLLVEDDLILQKIIARTLTEAGCDVVVVNGVAASRRVLSENVFDLVICDMSLVDGTGLDMITWVRHETNHPNQTTPFVVLTSNTDPAVHQMALNKGFLEVLQKPLSQEMARSLIRKYTGIEKQQHLVPDDIKDIIDIDATNHITGDESMRKEIFSMLSMLLQQDRKHLEDLYIQNDIIGTRDILHRLDGSFRYCVTPRLQRSRAKLHQAVRETEQLRSVEPLYQEFYQEIERYLTTYNQLKSQGRL